MTTSCNINKMTKTRSKHITGSKERYLLGRAKTRKISGNPLCQATKRHLSRLDVVNRLAVVSVWFCSSTKGITPKIGWFCLVLLNSDSIQLSMPHSVSDYFIDTLQTPNGGYYGFLKYIIHTVLWKQNLDSN